MTERSIGTNSAAQKLIPRKAILPTIYLSGGGGMNKKFKN